MSGVIPPMITPFAENDTIARALLRTETEYLLQAGVSGLVVAGSTGEGAGMSTDEIYEAVAIVMETVSGRIPVLCGVIADTTEEAVRLGIAARKAGAVGLQVPPPHFHVGVSTAAARNSRTAARASHPVVNLGSLWSAPGNLRTMKSLPGFRPCDTSHDCTLSCIGT